MRYTSGAVLGVALAFAMYWPDAELVVFPIPVLIRARTLVTILIGIDVFFSFLMPSDGIAHLATRHPGIEPTVVGPTGHGPALVIGLD